jgi:hypothetical protein
MRIALIVGVNYYEHFAGLFGCTADASAVSEVLRVHEDQTTNFDCQTILCTDHTSKLTRRTLKDQVEKLFKTDAEIALFYFAGHGYIDNIGGYLLASDSGHGDEGLSLAEVLAYANHSPSRNKMIILDSCHSGIAGTQPGEPDRTVLSQGLTILTASTEDQYATEQNGRGVFTTLLVDALHGGAANLVGDVSPGGIYSHIDQSLSAWEQRPVFKTNVKEFVSIRKVSPSIAVEDLRQMARLFPTKEFYFSLDPTFEPEMKGRDAGMPPPDRHNVAVFSVLQKFNRLNLLKPDGAPHMWHAAMQNKGCRLTRLGEHYRTLIEKGRI